MPCSCPIELNFMIPCDCAAVTQGLLWRWTFSVWASCCFWIFSYDKCIQESFMMDDPDDDEEEEEDDDDHDDVVVDVDVDYYDYDDDYDRVVKSRSSLVIKMMNTFPGFWSRHLIRTFFVCKKKSFFPKPFEGCTRGTWFRCFHLCVIFPVGLYAQQVALEFLRNSPKITSISNWLKRHGVDISKMDWSSIWNTFRGQLMDTLSVSWSEIGESRR